jgi:DNA invertase Pin-like site-specific DNA recombinase
MKIIAYYRVSTSRQKVSGLGLKAQRAAVRNFARSNGGAIVEEFCETESGRRCDRPELASAIAQAKAQQSTLVVAKIDRLARDVGFISTLRKSGVLFVAADMPGANHLTVNILAAVAEEEARLISERTRNALQAAKEKGTLLGSARPGHWVGREHKRGWRGCARAAEIKTARLRSVYASSLPLMRALQQRGEGPTAIARTLNEHLLLSPTGKPFTAGRVKEVLDRCQELGV